jgi:predicted SnoaL-like aldol condensation-catalyzing enzyme
MTAGTRKALAIDFLRSARAGDRTTVQRLVAPDARHHNPFFAAGMPALIDAMMAAAAKSQDHDIAIQRAVEEGNLVMVHSRVHLQPGDAGVAVVHIFRFEGDRIAELWDVAQPVPDEIPNADGMF